MASDRLNELMTKATEWLNEQEWFQELRGKWDELDPQSKTYLKFASAAGTVLLFLTMIISSIVSTYSLKHEVMTKSDLVTMIQSANDEIRRLKESTANAGGAGAGEGPWQQYLEGVATSAGVDKSALNVSPEKTSPVGDTVKEALIDVNLKHVNIKQIVRYAYALESGPRPVKLRNLTIDTKSDPSGYLDATLAVSAFSIKPGT